MKPDYLYVVRVVAITDADSMTVDVDLGFRTHLITPVRLYGLDAAPKRSPAGRAAQAYVESWFGTEREVLIRSAHPGEYGDKYGRWLATVYRDSRCLNDDLLSKGHAYPWDGTGLKPTEQPAKPEVTK